MLSGPALGCVSLLLCIGMRARGTGPCVYVQDVGMCVYGMCLQDYIHTWSMHAGMFAYVQMHMCLQDCVSAHVCVYEYARVHICKDTSIILV